jgi:hypothetical protein
LYRVPAWLWASEYEERRSRVRKPLGSRRRARQAGGRELWFYPTIGAAIAAGFPWLSFSCPACRQWGSVDLRTLDRHQGASISSLIPSVSCRWCSPHAPFAKLEMLTAEGP